MDCPMEKKTAEILVVLMDELKDYQWVDEMVLKLAVNLAQHLVCYWVA